jgi:membrane protein implicated in regulation of membrane protease activity
MNPLAIYIALSVFGLGVTIIDFIGVLEPSGDAGAGGDSADGDGADGDAADSDGADAADSDGADDAGADGDDTDSDSAADSADAGVAHHDHGSYLAPESAAGIKAVTGIMGFLRLLVYFSLGAGPTGLFALLRGLSPFQSLFWAAGVGAAIAVFARLLRKFIRRDLDSSIQSVEFLMEKAVLLLPLSPGEMARAVVRQYGKETELYVKCKDPAAAIPKGSEVRIIDFDNEVYWVEKTEAEE